MAKAGRPRKYKSADQMQKGIDAYFDECDAEDRPYTVAGLAYSLGFADRTAVWEYGKREEFSNTIKRAKTRIEMQRSERLVSGQGSAAGMIFDLKNNFGWRDTHEHNITEDVRLTISMEEDERVQELASDFDNSFSLNGRAQ